MTVRYPSATSGWIRLPATLYRGRTLWLCCIEGQSHTLRPSTGGDTESHHDGAIREDDGENNR